MIEFVDTDLKAEEDIEYTVPLDACKDISRT
jgi:hypothetical protein